MKEIKIKGHDGAVLSIAVSSYENPSAENADDSNWLVGKISISVGSFSGSYTVSLETKDFSYFQKDLSQILSKMEGKATFQTIEEWLTCEVEIKSRGNVVIKGSARTHTPNVCLDFEFESDQSFLKKTQEDMSILLKNYPVKP